MKMSSITSIIHRSVKFNNNIRVCRVCLIAKSENVIEMSSKNGLLALFKFCVGISLTSSDEPCLLCSKCAETIKTYAMFKHKCYQSDTFWKSVLVTSKMTDIDITKVDQKELSENNIDIDSDVNVPNSDDYCKIESPSLLGPSNIYEDGFELHNDENVSHEASINDTDIKNNKKIVIKVQKEDNLKIEHNPECTKKLNEEKPIENCKYCQKPYKIKRYLIKHLKSCPLKRKKRNENSIKIKKKILDCERDKGDPNSLINCIPEQAIDSTDNQTKDLIFCGLCTFTSTNDNDITQHLNEHWSGDVLECKLCDFIGVDLAHYAVHRYSHCPTVNQRGYQFRCHICEMKCPTLLTLHFHYRAVHLNKPGGLCWYCMKQYDVLKYWRKHIMRHEHLLVANYICDHCGQQFFYKAAIVDHMERYHLGTRKFICEACGRVFKRNSHLTIHRKNIHENSQPIPCPHCNRMFKSQLVLRKHQRRHTEKHFVCTVCSKTFVTQSDLSNHGIWHSDARPFKCSTCGAGYKVKSQLKIHMRRHTGDRPYQCEHCQRSFTSINPLKIHSSVHTGVRAHRCIHCERSFHEKKRLHAHVTKCHKVKDFETGN